MKSIAVFMDYLPGTKSGGPLKRVINMVNAFGDEFQIYVISRDHDFGEKTRFAGIKEGWNSVGKAKVLYLPDNQITTKKYGEILDEIKPQMVYTMTVFSVKCIFPCINAARKRNIPILIAPCGQTCKNSLMLKKWKKIPYLRVAKDLKLFEGIYFHTTSQEEYDSMIQYLAIKEDMLFNIPNIPRIAGVVNKGEKKKNYLRILFLSRIHRKKNLLFALEVLQKVKAECLFDIYGPLEDSEYWGKCQEAIANMPHNVTVNYKGAVNQEEAEKIYQNYDCFFFPTLSENYGFVIEEALLSRCPVVLTKGTTPWDDYEDYGHLLGTLGDHQEFVAILEKLASMDQNEYADLVDASQKYVEMKINYTDILSRHREMLNRVMQQEL